MSAFGKSEHQHLYPSDVNKRALVDLFLQFDLSTLYQRMLEYFFPTIILGAPLDESKKARLLEALGFLETMLKNKKFTTGDDFTLADLTLCVTVSQIEAFQFGLNPFPKVRKWLVECKNELESFGYAVSSMTSMIWFNFRTNSRTFFLPTGNQCYWRWDSRWPIFIEAEALDWSFIQHPRSKISFSATACNGSHHSWVSISNEFLTRPNVM